MEKQNDEGVSTVGGKCCREHQTGQCDHVTGPWESIRKGGQRRRLEAVTPELSPDYRKDRSNVHSRPSRERIRCAVLGPS